jgi:hypothetical protein
MVGFLLGAAWGIYSLARRLGGEQMALVALALVVTSPSLAFLETGRQVLGEVPALFFLVTGLLVWFSAWDGSRSRLTLAGVLLGASAVTKYQNLFMIAPAIAAGALANAAYYRTVSWRVFLWPGTLVVAVFGAWQGVFLLYIGPESAASNLDALREATAGAAAVFDTRATRRAVVYLLSFATYGTLLPLAIPLGFVLASERSRIGLQWGILTFLVVANFVWFSIASIGWPRYAFPGLALGGMLVAKVLSDLSRATAPATDPLRTAVGVWMAVVLGLGAVSVARPIVSPPENAPAVMSAYLTRHVSRDAVIETWEPELGALTAHNFHYPPNRLLATAIAYKWQRGPSPRHHYAPLETERPPYVVVGPFAKWVALYPDDVLQGRYQLLFSTGRYDLYERRPHHR